MHHLGSRQGGLYHFHCSKARDDAHGAQQPILVLYLLLEHVSVCAQEHRSVAEAGC